MFTSQVPLHAHPDAPSQVRTENPGEANLFYVPFLPMYRYFRERPHHQV